MKYGTTFLLSFLFLTPFVLRSQSWFEHNPQWVNEVTFGWSGPGCEYVTIQGDTVLAGKPAKILHRFRDMIWANDNSDIRIVRQNGDTIWCWNDYHNQFFIHYNFSLGVGDSVFVPIFSGGMKYVIDSIGVFEIDDFPIRFQRVSIPTNYDYFVCGALIIEKVGMIRGKCVNTNTNNTTPLTGWDHFFLDEPNSSAVDGPGWQFSQFGNDEFEYKQASTPCILLDAGTAPEGNFEISLAPNPFDDNVLVQMPDGEKIHSLRFFDISGRLIKSVLTPKSDPVSTADLLPGIYFLEIISEKDERQFAKAIKH